MIKVLNNAWQNHRPFLSKLSAGNVEIHLVQHYLVVWGGQSVIAAPTRNFRSSQSLHHNVTNKKTHQKKMKKISIIPLITLTPTLQITLDLIQRQRHVTSSPAATWPRREHKSTLRAPKSLVQITQHATTSIKLVATVCLLSLPKDILFIIIIIIIIPAMPRHTKGRGCYQAQAAQATSDQLGRFKVIQQNWPQIDLDKWCSFHCHLIWRNPNFQNLYWLFN